MKKLLLILTALLFIGVTYSQIIFSGISPASIHGNYYMIYGKTNDGWGGTDLGDTTIQDTLVRYLTDDLGCVAATNPSDIDGHIAILFRGDCEFGLKAKNAQNAGAIAVVLINNEPGIPNFTMAPGAAGSTVTIPVVLITDVDGAALLNAMDNGPVEVFMGNKNGYFKYDVGTGKGYILRPQYSSIPSSLATDGNDYSISLGTTVFNYGSLNQENVRLQAVIVFEGDTLYNETSTPINSLAAGDSIDLNLPDYAPTQWSEGYYSLNYYITSDTIDEYDFDNEFESDFVISPSDLSYASIDSVSFMPNTTGGSRAVNQAGDLFEEYASCLTFKNAHASRLAPKSISFMGLKGRDATDSSMAGETVLMQVLKYNDVFTDVTDNGYKNPIIAYSELMTKQYDFPSDLSDTVVTASFNDEDIVALEDNQRYLFCITSYNKNVYLGTDSKRDYTANLDFYKQPMFPVGAGGSFNPNGFGPTTVPSISVSFIDASGLGLKNQEMMINMSAYPSPASEQLNIEFNDNRVNEIELVNMMGQIVKSQDVKVNAENTTIDVRGVEDGLYMVKIHLTNNLTHIIRVLVSH